MELAALELASDAFDRALRRSGGTFCGFRGLGSFLFRFAKYPLGLGPYFGCGANDLPLLVGESGSGLFGSGNNLTGCGAESFAYGYKYVFIGGYGSGHMNLHSLGIKANASYAARSVNPTEKKTLAAA
jgi:hypothetical protein